MNLRMWLEANNQTYIDLGKGISVERMSAYRYVHKARKPRLDVAARIVSYTGGQVTFDDLYADPSEQKRKRKKK